MNDLILDEIDWEKVDGLLPVIVQDISSLKVLMLGFMNQEALKTTIETRFVTFYSRTKQRLWTKGESSTHFLKLNKIIPDCDNDTLLVLAEPCGDVCHLGTETCFGNGIKSPYDFLANLESVINDRYQNRQDKSYTAELFESGIKRIAQKVGEEGVEVALAAVTEPKPKIVNECADLLYHLLVLLRKTEITLAEVVDVLEQRHQ